MEAGGGREKSGRKAREGCEDSSEQAGEKEGYQIKEEKIEGAVSFFLYCLWIAPKVTGAKWRETNLLAENSASE